MVRYHGNKPPSLFGLSLVFPQQGSGRPMELGLLHPRIMMCTTCIRTSVPSEVSFSEHHSMSPIRSSFILSLTDRPYQRDYS